MTAQILASELTTLIQDSKRKNTELRNAAERSLQDLKALTVTSEAQLAADLSRRPHFIAPFLVACGTHNARFSGNGVSCLQRLSVARALPKERLPEVLDALRESVPLNNDTQLKILQALPSLLQNYPTELRGNLLANVLQICSAIQNVKNFAVSNTAAATLQQLVITVFDRVAAEDERALEIPTYSEVATESGPVQVRPAAHDAYKVLHDLNLLVVGDKPAYIRFASLPPTSTLELIETILSNHDAVVSSHPEQLHLLKSLLMPTIIRYLSDRNTFPITLRIIRVLNLVLRNYLHIMPSECEIALGLLNHMLDPDASSLWKRALCLEVFRSIYSDPRLLFQLYSLFDEQEGKRCIFRDNLAAFARLATEKPILIGLGDESTEPAMFNDGKAVSEQVVAEADALAGVISGPVSDTKQNGHAVGLSTQWSSMKTPCLDHLDKNDPPVLPDTYVHSLVLICITNVSETLAKFVLPLTVHPDGKSRRKVRTEELVPSESEKSGSGASSRRLSRTQSFRRKTVPVNPLDLADHPAFSKVQTASAIVTECWPAVYTACSTFLKAALDDEYYRQLVRAIQKFTQVAGLLRLSTPRDTFLTILGKSSLPSMGMMPTITSPKRSGSESPSVLSNAKALLSVDTLVGQASRMSMDRRPSAEPHIPSLRPRHLLCLRALLNLATALGTTLQSAWAIIFETLQVADSVMALSKYQNGAHTPGLSSSRPDKEIFSEKIEAEFNAVQAAESRLFESTVDFPNDAFVELLRALCSLLGLEAPAEDKESTPTASGRPKVLHQRRMGSVSGLSLVTESNARDSLFALNKIGDLATLNEIRLCHYRPDESGWGVFVDQLVRFLTDDNKTASARLLATDILCSTIRDMAKISMADAHGNEVQHRILSAIQVLIFALRRSYTNEPNGDVAVRIHQLALEALKNVIEQCGDSLVDGWDAVFGSLLSVFKSDTQISPGSNGEIESIRKVLDSLRPISRQLARAAFESLQLVCSDFLEVVPEKSLATLLELLLAFCRQQEDFNMSLTTITFFWNVSDFLRSRSELATLSDVKGSENLDQTSTATLWLQVLLDLTSVTTDGRAELRNSAVQSIQRIFENCSDQLSPAAWAICLQRVLFGMVKQNISKHIQLHYQDSVSTDELKLWNESTRIVLGCVGGLFASYMESVDDGKEVGQAWSRLLGYFEQYFDCNSHALGCSVFNTITAVLSKTEVAQQIHATALQKTAQLWLRYFDHREAWAARPQENQDAFVAYAEAFKAIYQLCGKSLQELPAMLTNLELCIKDSGAVAYSSDVDNMTQLQTQVTECLAMLDTSSEGLGSEVVKILGRLILLPYELGAADPREDGPTFVALSKASMSLLETVILHHRQDQDIYSSSAFDAAMKALAEAIREKYTWLRDGKAPALWQKATTTALAILSAGLPTFDENDVNEQTKKHWVNSFVITAMGITRAPIDPANPPATVEQDERFDIDAFAQNCSLMRKCLGWSLYPDRLRRLYALHLFETSLIHPLAPGEIPDREGLESEPLQNLYKIRLGQTKEHEPILRSEMAYACFEELLSMVSMSKISSSPDSNKDRIRVARAAAPYLILRAALPLKSYIADQPLRGAMPVPGSKERELLFALEVLRELDSAPGAIPEAPGVKSQTKRHLHRLYPLLVRALGVSRGNCNRDVFERLRELVEMVGAEFGVEE